MFFVRNLGYTVTPVPNFVFFELTNICNSSRSSSYRSFLLSYSNGQITSLTYRYFIEYELYN